MWAQSEALVAGEASANDHTLDSLQPASTAGVGAHRFVLLVLVFVSLPVLARIVLFVLI